MVIETPKWKPNMPYAINTHGRNALVDVDPLHHINARKVVARGLLDQ
jgi:hypothetical protein